MAHWCCGALPANSGTTMSDHDLYDELAYSGYPYAQTHPDRLATNAILFGMAPAPVTSCRVLELGCGDGSNLIPMAFQLPESEFLGVDRAARPIAKASATAANLELKNILFRLDDIADLPNDLGRFDYIIAHGLYSWVPDPLQEKILKICKSSLAPQGVAYISYNTLPGGRLRQMMREMMLFHARTARKPRERIDRARELVRLLSEAQPAAEGYAQFLNKQLQFISSRADEALFHDDLAEINAPLYFHQFAERAAAHGLQYLSEADLMECQAGANGPLLTEAWRAWGHDLIAQEQYFDFLKCRMFRQTLLCHAGIALDRRLDAETVRRFFIASSARPVSSCPDVASPGVIEQFRVANGALISIDFPWAKAALLHLGRLWPESVSCDSLVREVAAILREYPSAEPAGRGEIGLREFLLKTYGAGLVELHSHRRQMAFRPSERPMASSLARLQLREGPLVTTLRHETIKVEDPLAARLILLVDGSRDRQSLLADLNRAAQALTEHTGITAGELDQKLEEVARLGLLVA